MPHLIRPPCAEKAGRFFIPRINMDHQTSATTARAVPMLAPPPFGLLDAQELAAGLRIAKNKFEALVRTPGFPRPIRLGKQRLWRQVEVEQWIATAARAA